MGRLWAGAAFIVIRKARSLPSCNTGATRPENETQNQEKETMNITTEIIMRLNEPESNALKKMLGILNGHHKEEAGLTADEQKIITEIYRALPHPDEGSES